MSISIDVADSWLSVDGRVLAFAAHERRFADSVEHMGGSREAALTAIGRAREDTPPTGRHFPRVVFADGAFEHTVRAAPERMPTAVLWTSPVDPRTQPEIKGPDLVELGGLRLLAAEHGATEAVIVDDDGHVVEGAYASLAWWRGDALHAPPADVPRVRSVTWQAVQAIAASLGVELREEQARPDDLAGCEIWVMSALHGIRGAAAWVGGPEPAAPERAPLWQARLEALRGRDAVR